MESICKIITLVNIDNIKITEEIKDTESQTKQKFKKSGCMPDTALSTPRCWLTVPQLHEVDISVSLSILQIKKSRHRDEVTCPKPHRPASATTSGRAGIWAQ